MASERQAGTLRERSLPALFMELSAQGASGNLALTRAGVSKTIYFDQGQVVFAASTSPNDRLGEVLMRHGRLRIGDFLGIQLRMKPGKKLGALLVEEGLLPAEQLMAAVIDQVRTIILSLFDWEEGDFVFTPESEIPKGILRMELPVRDIVRAGISRIDNFAAILAGVGDLQSRCRLSPDCERLLEGWTLGEPENKLLAALGDPKQFSDLSDLKQMTDIDLARFLWSLKVLGIIQPVSESEASVDAMMDDAFSATPDGNREGAVMMRSGVRKAPAKSATDEAFDRLTIPGETETATPDAPVTAPASAPEPAPEPAPAPEPIISAPVPDEAPEQSVPRSEVGLSTQPLPPVRMEPETPDPVDEIVAGAAVPGDDFAPPEDFNADDLDFGLSGDDLEGITPSGQETAAPVEAPPDEISRALAEFGIKQMKIIKVLTEKSAEKTTSFVGFCLREARKTHPRLFQGMEPDASGLLPLDKLLANIRTQKLSNYSAGFRDFHDILTRRSKTWQGIQVARVCRQIAGLPKTEEITW